MNKNEYSFYRIVSPSGKKYYGITGDYAARMEQHRKASKRKNSPLYAAVRKYTWEGMRKELLCEGALPVIKQLEMSAIAVDNTLHPGGYNLTKGGDGILGYKHSADTKAKLASCTKDQFSDPAKAENHRAAMEKAKPLLRDLALAQHGDPEKRARFLAAHRSKESAEANRARNKKRLDALGHGITKGYVWITDGVASKSLPAHQAEPFLSSGWKRGRTLRRSVYDAR